MEIQRICEVTATPDAVRMEGANLSELIEQ